MNKSVAVQVCKGGEQRHKELFHLRPCKFAAVVGKIITVGNGFDILMHRIGGVFIVNYIRHRDYVIVVAEISQCVEQIVKIRHKALVLCLVAGKRRNFAGKLVALCHVLRHIFFDKSTFFIFRIETDISYTFAVHAYHATHKVSVAHHCSYRQTCGVRRCVFVISASAFSVFVKP